MTTSLTIRDIVQKDYRAADVFDKWSINYCCTNTVTLQEACTQKNLDPSVIESELRLATHNYYFPNIIHCEQWPIPFLTDFIIYVYHGYFRMVIPTITHLSQLILSRHLEKYPYLFDVLEAFRNVADELEDQMVKEEDSIFPYVKQICNTYSRKEVYGSLFVRTMSKPVNDIIQKDYTRLLSLVSELRDLTRNYTFEAEACTNHQVLYHKLQEFEDNLVRYKQLENEILFPKVLEMEKSLLQV